MKKEFTKNEKYATKFLEKNGFEFEMLRQYNSKTKFMVKRDGISYVWELPAGVEDIRKYMNLFLFCHNQKVEFENLKKE